MRPPAPSTRCHGRLVSFGATLSAKPASRARPGRPAARATAPYVETCPRGMAQTTSQIAWIEGLSSADPPRRGLEFLPLGGRKSSANDFFERAIAHYMDDFEVRKRRRGRDRPR